MSVQPSSDGCELDEGEVIGGKLVRSDFDALERDRFTLKRNLR